MKTKLKSVAESIKAAHQSVSIDGVVAGEIWREQAHVVVSKLTEPRRMALKWRWFAKPAGQTATLGRGTRSAMLFGAGFRSKEAALKELEAALAKKCEVVQGTIAGYFVDWNGNTRSVESPGPGYTCSPVRVEKVDGKEFQAVDVLDESGCVVHEAVYYPTLAAIEVVGVVVNLIE